MDQPKRIAHRAHAKHNTPAVGCAARPPPAPCPPESHSKFRVGLRRARVPRSSEFARFVPYGRDMAAGGGARVRRLTGGTGIGPCGQPTRAPTTHALRTPMLAASSMQTLLPNSCQIHAKFMPNSCQIHAEFMPNSCQIHAKFMPNSCQTCQKAQTQTQRRHGSVTARRNRDDSIQTHRAGEFGSRAPLRGERRIGAGVGGFRHGVRSTGTAGGRAEKRSAPPGCPSQWRTSAVTPLHPAHAAPVGNLRK
jgi:hypothetical protein